jgi:intracellular sulfur oxidation DsrE/DsrF family protein
MDQYSNVSFIACSNAINRLRMQGVEPKIIAHSKTGDTAVERIVKRLQEGWVYVKV